MIETIVYLFTLSFNCMGFKCKLEGSAPDKDLITYQIRRIKSGLFKINIEGSKRILCSIRSATRRNKPVHGYMYPTIVTSEKRKAKFTVETYNFKKNGPFFVNAHFDFNCAADFDKRRM